MNENETRQWAKIGESLGLMRKRQLHKLTKMARRELNARWQADEALNKRRQEGFRGLANFMAGVTWALACRTALRESKGHTPVGGKRPQSGEMWLPRELLTAVRHQVKDRCWHPITAPDWDTVRNNLLSENRAAPRHIREGELEVAQFAVRMASPTYAATRMACLDAPLAPECMP